MSRNSNSLCGTGKSASQDDAQKMCKVVRDVVAADFGQEVADKVRPLSQLAIPTFQLNVVFEANSSGYE